VSSKKKSSGVIGSVLNGKGKADLQQDDEESEKEAIQSANGVTKKRSRILSDSESDSDEDDKVPIKKDRKDVTSSKTSKDVPETASKASTSKEDDEDVDMEEEEEEAEEEEEEKQKEGKAIKKMAAIFEKKPPTEAKASWKAGDPVPYSALAQTFAEIEATTKRLVILETLTNFYVKVIRLSPDDLLPCVYLCINRLCPDYEGLELGIGESLLIKSIAQSTGRDVARLKKDLEQKGDLGLVAIVSECFCNG